MVWLLAARINRSSLPPLAITPPLTLKVIPQKLNFLMNFFETFSECSLPSTVSKNTIKMIGHHSRLRDAMGQSCPIYACTSANHARHPSVHVTFCGSSKHSF